MPLLLHRPKSRVLVINSSGGAGTTLMSNDDENESCLFWISSLSTGSFLSSFLLFLLSSRPALGFSLFVLLVARDETIVTRRI